MSEQKSMVLVLGMFDGVHMGHRALINYALACAKEHASDCAVYTFSNHPRSVFAKQPILLNTTQERERVLKSLGVDIYMDAFTQELAAYAPERFVQMLLSRFQVVDMLVGFNYTFGCKGAGTAQTLTMMGEAYGFCTHVLPPVVYEGEPVSSTRIRECIECGDVRAACAMLCTPYALEGQVVSNKHLGTSMGFPTANIELPAYKAIPKHGVYATSVEIEDGQSYIAVTNIGNNPTMNGEKTTIETHVLDFEGDLYGKNIRVHFQSRIRDEIRFSSQTELRAQIERDVAFARDSRNKP